MCREALLAARRRAGLTRSARGGRGFRRLTKREAFRRDRCGKRPSPTAGTVSRDAKPPPAVRFRAVCRPTPGRGRNWLGRAGAAARGAAADGPAGELRRRAGPGHGRRDAPRRRGREAARAHTAHGSRGVAGGVGREARRGGGRARRRRGQRRRVLLAGGRGGRPPPSRRSPNRASGPRGGRRPVGSAPRPGTSRRRSPARTTTSAPGAPDPTRPVSPTGSAAAPARRHRRAARLGRGSRRTPALPGVVADA